MLNNSYIITLTTDKYNIAQWYHYILSDGSIFSSWPGGGEARRHEYCVLVGYLNAKEIVDLVLVKYDFFIYPHC